jgi:serine protease Do
VRPRTAALTDEDAVALGLPTARGILITSVDPGSSAEAAGLRAGDVVIEFHGSPVDTVDDLSTRVSAAAPGSRAPLVVIRDGHARAIEVGIEELASPGSAKPHRRVERPANFGLTLTDDRRDGSLVEQVEPDSVAADAGLEPGDILRKVNRRAVRSAAEAQDALRRVPLGSTVFLVISRDDAEQVLELRAY